jgi:Zn-dependent peptidase ImmA (M78 family)
VNDIKKSKKQRCPAIEPDENLQDEWTDEDWMEWQANGIAPRILMPKYMFIQAADNFRRELSGIGNSYVLNYKLKDKLAEFFQVSKQSAGIRMQELGI